MIQEPIYYDMFLVGYRNYSVKNGKKANFIGYTWLEDNYQRYKNYSGILKILKQI